MPDFRLWQVLKKGSVEKRIKKTVQGTTDFSAFGRKLENIVHQIFMSI